MAHHQGMTIVAIANALLDGEMRTRFHAEPIVQATELLLAGADAARGRGRSAPGGGSRRPARRSHDLELPAVRHLRSAHDATPAAHLLSNGRYAVMLTAAGSGYSRWRDLAVTRWREDATSDDWGAYIYPARRPERRRMVGGLSAERRRARRLRRQVQRGQGRIHPARRDHHHGARNRRFAGGRRRGSPLVRFPTPATGSARSRSPPMPSWCWRRRPMTRRIRPS